MARGENLKSVQKPGPGRPKGSKDKLSRNIRDRVVQVWDQLEKTPGKSLKSLSVLDPKWFFETFGRALLPKEITAEVNSTVTRIDIAIQAARLVITGQPTPALTPAGLLSPVIEPRTVTGETSLLSNSKIDVTSEDNSGMPSSLHNGSYANMEQKQ